MSGNSIAELTIIIVTAMWKLFPVLRHECLDIGLAVSWFNVLCSLIGLGVVS